MENFSAGSVEKKRASDRGKHWVSWTRGWLEVVGFGRSWSVVVVRICPDLSRFVWMRAGLATVVPGES